MINTATWNLLRWGLLPLVTRAATDAGLTTDGWDLELTDDGEMHLVIIRQGGIDAILARFTTALQAEQHLNGMRQAYHQMIRAQKAETTARERRERLAEAAARQFPALHITSWTRNGAPAKRLNVRDTPTEQGNLVAVITGEGPGGWLLVTHFDARTSAGVQHGYFDNWVTAFEQLDQLWTEHWTTKAWNRTAQPENAPA